MNVSVIQEEVDTLQSQRCEPGWKRRETRRPIGAPSPWKQEDGKTMAGLGSCGEYELETWERGSQAGEEGACVCFVNLTLRPDGHG